MDSQRQPYNGPRPDNHDPMSTVDHPYPPNSTPYSSDTPYNSYTKPEQDRIVVRTPSPTPSEQKELKSGVFDWKTLGNWRFWIRREWLWYYVALFVILVITALVTIFHKQIVHWLTPVTRWLHDLPFGWLVPIAVLFVISFPPLFGHEIVAILCGLVWGLWIGFGIVCAGTFLGEVGNFYAFKYCCRSRGEKLEKTQISYACLAKVVRDGGFKIALIARLSAIPGHFTTAVFSTCGMGIIVFSIAAILSMPKQFITVYLGVILEQSSTGEQDTKSKIISDVVLGITIIITFLAMWYIYHQMNKVKPQVIYERRKARQAKLARAEHERQNNAFSSESTVVLQPYDTDSIPLTSQAPRNSGPYENVYAPRPVAAGHSPGTFPDHEAGGFHGYISRESTDSVAWDMSSPAMMHSRPEDTYGMPYTNTGNIYHPERLPNNTALASSSSLPPHDTRLQQQDSATGASAHELEPTDATYRTALNTSSMQASVDDLRALPTLGYSRRAPSPPPSYR